jgi:predicted methyltransferase
VVGPTGHIWLMTPASFQAKQQKGADDLAASLSNTTVLFQPGDSPMTPEKVDVIWTTDNYHDYRNPGFGAVDMEKFNKAVFDSLKPGGEFIVVDYVGAPGTGATQTGTLHRIEEATVKAEVEAAGFKFEAESAVLANKADDHTQKIFEMKPRGVADQFVLRFRKPK